MTLEAIAGVKRIIRTWRKEVRGFGHPLEVRFG